MPLNGRKWPRKAVAYHSKKKLSEALGLSIKGAKILTISVYPQYAA